MFSVYMLVLFSFSSSIKLSPKPSKQKYAQVLFIFPGKPRMTSHRRNPSVVEERMRNMTLESSRHACVEEIWWCFGTQQETSSCSAMRTNWSGDGGRALSGNCSKRVRLRQLGMMWGEWGGYLRVFLIQMYLSSMLK